jgi:hypothetical protein
MNMICCPRAFAWFVVTVVLLVGEPTSTRAQTLLIDFGNDTTYRSLSVQNPDTNGNYWNSIQPGALTMDLVDIDNTASTIDIDWDTPVGFDSFNGPAGATGPEDNKQDLRDINLPLTDIDPVALGNLGGALEGPFDFAAGPSLEDNRVQFQIQQLDPARKYTLTFFGSHKFSTDTTTVYSIYTDENYTTLVEEVSLDVQEPGSPNLHNRDRVATISNVSPQADNILYVQFVGSNGSLGYLNAMQIESSLTVLTGDYNNNGAVDAADYVVWRENLNTNSTLLNNSLPGPIGPPHYAQWRANFGASSGPGIAAVVPEPAAFIFNLLIVAGLVFRHGHRRPHPGFRYN